MLEGFIDKVSVAAGARVVGRDAMHIDTLVVETVNFNEDTWLIDDGAFHTKDLKVVERLRCAGDTLEYQVTSFDPAVLTEPWVKRPQTLVITDQELEESPRCEDRDLGHMVDGSHHANPR